MKQPDLGARRSVLLLILPALILAGCAGSAAINEPVSLTPPAATASAASTTPATNPVLATTDVGGGTPAQSASSTEPPANEVTPGASSPTALAAATEPVAATAPAATATPAATAAAATAPATNPAPAATVEPVTPIATAAVSATQTLPATQSAPSATADANVLYQDDFKNPASGWPDELVFQDYYVGYHEPDFYHVEVHVPNDSTLVAAPGHTFDNFEAEARILVSVANTAPNGDFRYGLAVRRAGNHYYAFTISPRSQRWYVLKSGSGNLIVLDQGEHVPIRGLKAEDTLRVNADGSVLTFWLNDVLVSQINDTDYTGGEVGFYVETFDAPKVHIHYDDLIVRLPENPPPPAPTATPAPALPPSLACTVTVNLLRLRAAPQAGNEPTIAGLFAGTQLDASPRSADGNWLWVHIHGQDQTGWVSTQPGLISCDGGLDVLAIATPASSNTTRTP